MAGTAYFEFAKPRRGGTFRRVSVAAGVRWRGCCDCLVGVGVGVSEEELEESEAHDVRDGRRGVRSWVFGFLLEGLRVSSGVALGSMGSGVAEGVGDVAEERLDGVGVTLDSSLEAWDSCGLLGAGASSSRSMRFSIWAVRRTGVCASVDGGALAGDGFGCTSPPLRLRYPLGFGPPSVDSSRSSTCCVVNVEGSGKVRGAGTSPACCAPPFPAIFCCIQVCGLTVFLSLHHLGISLLMPI